MTHPLRLSSRLAVVAAAAMLAGCAAPRHTVIVDSQTTARPPVDQAVATAPTGAIFQPVAYRPLFEDRRPRYIGDLLTIQINEKLNASQKANSSADRSSDVSMTMPAVKGVLGSSFKGFSGNANTSNTFEGKGETASSNQFTGTITVTVIEVLPNGNLLVAGEKQIGIRQNSEVLRFKGVVDPKSIQPGNFVSSTMVADARLDYRGGGYIEEAQIQGWLARFFNSWMPF